MSSSRESSPDWLRSFQVPSHSRLTLSSDSGSSRDGGSWNEDKTDVEGASPKSPRFLKVTKSNGKTPEAASPKVEEQTPSKRKKVDKKKPKEGNKEEKETANESNIDKHIDHKHEISGEGECVDGLVLGKSPSKKGSKEKSSQKQIDIEDHTPVKGKEIKASAKGKGIGDLKVEEEETCEKPAEPNVSSARLPLMLSEKVQRTKALIECQGDSIDLSGDMGAVGRIIISDSPSGDQEMCLDLKGTIYKTSIVPCRTFCVVSFGQSEAKGHWMVSSLIRMRSLARSRSQLTKLIKMRMLRNKLMAIPKGRLTKHQVLERKEVEVQEENHKQK
uniref:DNA-binding protein BIN4 n=1 Tax=Glycine max TaxID=3847 RepID=A0A0R0KI25_SOYBN